MLEFVTPYSDEKAGKEKTMTDANGVQLADGDFIETTCPFCGWEESTIWQDEDRRKLKKCIYCKKRYRVAPGDMIRKEKNELHNRL